ncbi:MAG: hypothetical protein A2915_04025 [Candidatus Yanofskybacteria bacterium RIFCSPLOWO2_01_FULL_41_34]|uniref:Lipoprotein n=1 Tax=Candidatus Yanofskybacteria bacterium RIFCSPHIGHO2_01_FULL_41_26 TaxID=1802661 RepID=A0A1F8EBL3_9BACT|nr:MAG: hypothetical protein A2649_03120 [Candidatus Yanofskybacteria bacterium RIFCSPHIGHO2_01_FULL_41_26]OGN21577.1 MAG: hypothetical protein A2915_04025 [Candidatus Yanofskybacteria bacterium RIFCSPLOWO2_01_FULL_41_34]
MTKNLLNGFLAAVVSGTLLACGGSPTKPTDPNKRCTLAPVHYFRQEISDFTSKNVTPDIKMRTATGQAFQWQAFGVVRLGDNEPNGHWISVSGFENISPGEYEMWARDDARFIFGGSSSSHIVGRRLLIGEMIELTKMVSGDLGGEYARFTLTNACTIQQ